LYLIQARKLSILSESLRAVSTSETKHWETPLGTITINWEELSLRELSRRWEMRRTKETRRRFQMRMTKERWMQSMQEGDEEGVQAQSIDTYHYTPALKAFINTDYSQGCSTADHNNTHNSSSRSRRK
jgi:hypothetical protein